MELQPGEVLFRDGDPGECMYAVVEGEVVLTVHGVAVEEVGPGGILGEMALIDTAQRSATATALTTTRAARIDKRQFTFLVHEHPTFALQVMTAMAERLRHANTRVEKT